MACRSQGSSSCLLCPDAGVSLQCIHTRDMNQIGFPRRASPTLHFLQIITTILTDYKEISLHIFVIKLLNKFICLKAERRFSISDNQDGTLSSLAPCTCVHYLRKSESLSHICKALFVWKILQASLHQR